MDYNNNLFLIARLKEGDKQAYNYLIDCYYAKLCVYANSLINNHIQAEDVVQNVFLRLWEKRDKLSSNFLIKSFLYRAVYNEFIDQYRKTQAVLRIEKVYIDYLNTTILNEDDQEELNETIKKVKEIIKELPPACREIFELSKQQGLTNIEISEYLNISVKSVEAQITRGFSTIRKKLKNRITNFMLFFYLPKILRRRRLC
ncbi:RNA polymerase sigma-70 factor [Flavobacteriaceae bacterium F08102]|nr:RNA polymerase sigma-70 factor [Flavobacteriaceae bacterium F08102]